MLDDAINAGWRSIRSIPRAGEGEFLVLTISGLVRRARNHRELPRFRAADGYGPRRTSVVAVESGNYLTAIAWKPISELSST